MKNIIKTDFFDKYILVFDRQNKTLNIAEHKVKDKKVVVGKRCCFVTGDDKIFLKSETNFNNLRVIFLEQMDKNLITEISKEEIFVYKEVD